MFNRPVSGILYPSEILSDGCLSFIWVIHRCITQAAYPPASDEQPSNTGIFGLATHKVYPCLMSP